MSTEQHFSLLIESSPDAVVVYDLEGNVTYVNPAFERIFGWTEAELLNKRLDFVPPESQAETAEFIKTVLQEGQLPAVNTKRFTKNGRIIDVQLTGALGRNEAGEAVSSIVILRDITQQSQADRERQLLLESEREQRLLAESLTEVTLALTSHTTLAAVLDEILIQAHRLVSYTTANIALLEDQALRIAGSRGYEDIGKEDFIADLVQPLSKIPLSAQAIQTRKPLIIKETQEQSDSIHYEQAHWIRSYIGMPLAFKNQVVGMLRVNSDEPHHFSEQDVLRLTPLAQVAALAIENARLLEQTQEERYRIVLEASPDPVIVYDEEQQITYVNDAFTRTFGWSAAEVLGDSVPFIPKDNEAETEQAWQDFLAAGSLQRFETVRQTKDGRLLDIEMNATHTLGPTNNKLSIVTLRDITSAKEAARALRESEIRYRSLVDTSTDAIITANSNGIIIGSNQALENIFGYQIEDIVGRPISILMPEHYREAHQAGMKRFEETGESHVMGHVVELHGVRKNGDEFPLELSLNTWEIGDKRFYSGLIRDITERKEAEQALHANEIHLRQQNQSLIELARSEAITSGDLATAYAQITETAARIVGVERVSIWRYYEDRIEAEDLYIASEDSHSQGLVLRAADYPAYFEAILAERVIPAHDAHTDPRTQEFTENYLIPAGITSMLDASAQVGDQTRAVLCLEHVGPARQWTLEEQNYCHALTDLLSLAMEAQERTRLEQRVQESLDRRVQEIQLLTQMAQEITLAPDLPDLYKRLVNLVKEQFGYYHTQLLRYNPTLDVVELIAGYGEVGEKMLTMHHSMPMGVGLIGKAAQAGQTILSPNVVQDANWQPNPLLNRTKGELVVPIKIGERILGVLDVQSDVAHKLDVNDQILLEGLCGQIAVAIDSANLRQEMSDRIRELNLLQQLMIREGWQDYPVSANTSVPGYIFNKAEVQPLLAESAKQTNGNQISLNNGHRNITQPLNIRGTTIGVIGVEDDPERPLSEDEQNFLTSISEQVAEALEMARLLSTTQDALVTQERLSTELRTVAEVSTVTSTIMERDRLLQNVVDLTKTSFNLYHAHLYLLDDDSETLSLIAGADQVGRLMTLEENHIPLNANSIVARAARSREPIVENDVRQSQDYVPHPLLPRTKSELAAPMIVGDRLVGVLDVQSDILERFAEQDILIMRTLASQVAVAAQNAEQFAEQVETAEKLREVEKLKSEFLASMSHELRTPLNSIIGFADVLLEGLDGPLNDRMEEDVRLIRDSGDHLRNLIGDILDMSKIEAGKMDLRYEEIDMHQMAHDIVATATPLAQAKGLKLHLSLADELFPILADRTRIRQILWNIMGNAIKFTAQGSVMLSMQTQENNILVAIRDTGIGIAPENVPIVFEQFRQVEGSLNRTAEGTGLGMPITKKLVELHSGEIWVESALGEGSTFWFTLPRFPAPQNAAKIN